MAQIHETTMSPGKLELLAEWLPRQRWYVDRGEPPRLSRAGGFRLDDPGGEVGIELMVVRDNAGGDRTTYLVPMTYRGEPLPGADDALVGTGEHGVLGCRWVYDATRDPVALGQILALLQGEAEPQHQSLSDTPDPTVVVRNAHPDGWKTGSVDVTDSERTTDVRVTGAQAGAGAVTVHLLRVLRADAIAEATDGRDGATTVEACWRLSDGTERTGTVIVAEWPTG